MKPTPIKRILLVLAVLPALYWWVRRRNGLL